MKRLIQMKYNTRVKNSNKQEANQVELHWVFMSIKEC